MLFLAPLSNARPTNTASRAVECSVDRVTWTPLDARLSPVTGLLSSGAYAFVLRSLTLVDEPIDVWAYAVCGAVCGAAQCEPVRFRLGASTLCVEECDTSACVGRMKSRMRRVCAVGELVNTVWVR